MSTRTIILISLLATIGLVIVFATTGAPAWVIVTLTAFALIEAFALVLPKRRQR